MKHMVNKNIKSIILYHDTCFIIVTKYSGYTFKKCPTSVLTFLESIEICRTRLYYYFIRNFWNNGGIRYTHDAISFTFNGKYSIMSYLYYSFT